VASTRSRRIRLSHSPHGLALVVLLLVNSMACTYLSYDVVERARKLPPQETSPRKIIRVERSEVVGSRLQLELVRATRVDLTVETRVEKTADYRARKGIVYDGFGIPIVDTLFTIIYFIPDAIVFLASSVVMYPAGQVASIDSTGEEIVKMERDVSPLANASIDVSIEAFKLHEQAVTDAAGFVTIDLSSVSTLGGSGPIAVRVHSRTDGLVAKSTLRDEQLAALRPTLTPVVEVVEVVEVAKVAPQAAPGTTSGSRVATRTTDPSRSSLEDSLRRPPPVAVDSYRRVALIIGNSGYKSLPALANPKRDAADLAKSLRTLGFEVILRNEQNLSQMKSGLREFAARLGPDTVGFFYYAGHAVQSDGANYLVPLGADIQAPDEIEHETLDMARVLGKMEASQSPIKLVFIDVCRNDPFSRFRSASRGLAVTPAPGGTLIAYATAPGDVASDGDGRNSPFASHLIAAINTPGLELKEVISRVQQGVYEETNSRQRPWLSSDIFRPFYFEAPSRN
jgi:hypothetical protein